MQSNLSFIKSRMAQTIALGGRGSALVVTWSGVTGGELNPSTGAMVGGEETIYSGVMPVIALEEVPRSVLRQFQEIQAGDLIVDCLPDPMVTVWGPSWGGSGVVPLSSLSGQGVQFQWQGKVYAQQKVGEDLASIWALVVSGVNLAGGMLLRRQV
jgi:hypothetical protein